jgi:anti-anti-sigma regulatory factor
VSFCDCAGLALLLDALLRARKAGACFGVIGADAPTVKRLFSLTGTDGLLRLGKPAA